MPFPKYPFLFLSIAIFSCFHPCLKAQNLIADWSAEDYHTCPTGLWIDPFIDTWYSMRGTADYFHMCSPTTVSPVNNLLGWQQPRTGEAILGAITYHGGLQNAREYPGTELIEPLVIGEIYELSFWVSLAYSTNDVVAARMTNNLGVLLLTSPWLSLDELGAIPNFAHINADTLVTDTTNWINISGIILADSAYQYVAFGNFFDDSLTQWEFYDSNNQGSGTVAYYFFDDFCVVPLGGDCSLMLSQASNGSYGKVLLLYPNPASGLVYIGSNIPVREVRLLAITGGFCRKVLASGPRGVTQIPVDGLQGGVYIAEIETEKGVHRQRLVVNP